MTSEVANMNGNYAQTQSQGYDQSYNSQSNTQSNGDYNNNASSTTAQTNGSSTNTPEIPKDEVGWYFVEQYYTTLSRSPEKLYVSDLKKVIDYRILNVSIAILQQAFAIRVWY